MRILFNGADASFESSDIFTSTHLKRGVLMRVSALEFAIFGQCYKIVNTVVCYQRQWMLG